MRTLEKTLALSSLLGLGASCLVPAVSAQTVMDSDILTLSSFEVIGSKESIALLPGSGYYLDTAEINTFDYTNINDLLRKVPGVYVRDEDGYGLFPNISIRGVDGVRSSKLTIMEDGIITAPAPYSDPAAYYAPTAGRMSALEVLKGSSQIKYGPRTTGGIINYVSTPIPQTTDLSGRVKATYGEHDFISTHAYTGQQKATDWGTFGYLFEVYHEQTDGFRTIDNVGNMTNPNATGYEKTDWMLKFGWQLPTENYNYIEVKMGYSDFDSNETYLGLTDADHRNDPHRRYAASRLDQIDTYQSRFYIRHVGEISDAATLNTTAYYNRFHRNWYKLQDVNAGGGFINPALAIGAGGPELDVLRGDAAGQLRVRANNRDYYGIGIQSNLDYQFYTGDLEHNLDVGVRLHKDRAERFQWQDVFDQDANGDWTLVTPGVPGSQDNRTSNTVAFAAYVEDTITHDRWTVKPGVRFEHLRYENLNRTTGVESDIDDLNVIAPGLSLGYQYTENLYLFAGYHRGMSTPGPGDRANDIKEETSNAFEAGLRYNNNGHYFGEFVLFYTNFSNLIVPESISSGTNATENVGKVNSQGFELLVGADLGRIQGWSFGNPYTFALTYTDATFRDGGSNNPESIFGAAESGNRLPYVPEWQFNVTTGLEFERFRTYLSGTFVDSVFTSGNNSDSNINPNTGNPDARFGSISSYFIVDWSAHFAVRNNLEVFVAVKNLLDEDYISSRLPHGARSGAPRLASIGLDFSF